MSETLDNLEKETQAARATLRATFIKKLLELKGKPCTINLHEMNKVEGVFQGADVDLQELLFDDLKTPYSILPHSIVRGHDILFIEFPEQMKCQE